MKIHNDETKKNILDSQPVSTTFKLHRFRLFHLSAGLRYASDECVADDYPF